MSVTAEDVKVKNSRTPRNYESIEKGALSLDLKERVELRNRLTLSIDSEIKEMQERLNMATELVNGKVWSQEEW